MKLRRKRAYHVAKSKPKKAEHTIWYWITGLGFLGFIVWLKLSNRDKFPMFIPEDDTYLPGTQDDIRHSY